jgi:hypothetical protein
MAINLTRVDDEPLSQRFRAVEARLTAAEDDLLHLYFLEVVLLIRDPFPAATELIVDVDPSDLAVTLITVTSGRTQLYARRGDGADMADYRTADGATFTELVDALERTLGSMLGAQRLLSTTEASTP